MKLFFFAKGKAGGSMRCRYQRGGGGEGEREEEVVRERGLEREGREVMQKSARLILIGR